MVLNSSPAKLARKMGNSIFSLSNPIDTLIDKARERKQEKFVYQCETMSDEELMTRFAEYILWTFISNTYKEEKIMLFTKGAFRERQFSPFRERIMYKLTNISDYYTDEKLKKWKHYNEKAKLMYQEPDGELLHYELSLHMLLIDALKRYENVLDVYYEDLRKTDILERENAITGGMYENWLDRIGYKSTLIIKLK